MNAETAQEEKKEIPAPAAEERRVCLSKQRRG